MSEYDQVEDGDWVHFPRRGIRMACCDCGLVHLMMPKIIDGRIMIRVHRSERATAALRRSKQLAHIKKAIKRTVKE